MPKEGQKGPFLTIFAHLEGKNGLKSPFLGPPGRSLEHSSKIFSVAERLIRLRGYGDPNQASSVPSLGRKFLHVARGINPDQPLSLSSLPGYHQ